MDESQNKMLGEWSQTKKKIQPISLHLYKIIEKAKWYTETESKWILDWDEGG